MNEELPQQLRNALEMRGLVAIPKERYDWLMYRQQHTDYMTGRWLSPSFKYAFKNLFKYVLRPGNLRVELNPAVHVRRHRLDKHLKKHGCGTGDVKSPTYIGGMAHCEEAMRLWDVLPGKDRVVIG